MRVSRDHFSPAINHADMIASVESAFAGSMHPLSLVAALGRDLLNAARGDLGAMRIRWDSDATFHLVDRVAYRAFGGRVGVNAMILAAIAGREDLWPRFLRGGQFHIEAGLQWFVLHGIGEHRLWHFLTGAFVASLLRPPAADAGMMPPLAAILLCERPDLGSTFMVRDAFSQARFEGWLAEHGVNEYGLFWCMGATQLARWGGKGWIRGSADDTPGSPTLAGQAAGELSDQGPGDGLRWAEDRAAFWRHKDRCFPVAEFAKDMPARCLIVDGLTVPTHSGPWTVLASGDCTLALLPRNRPSPFVMIEVHMADPPQDLAVDARIDGVPVPFHVLRSDNSWCFVVFCPRRDSQPKAVQLRFAPAQLAERNLMFDLVRIWNF